MKICQKMSCSKSFKPDYNAISSSICDMKIYKKINFSRYTSFI